MIEMACNDSSQNDLHKVKNTLKNFLALPTERILTEEEFILIFNHWLEPWECYFSDFKDDFTTEERT